MKKLFFCVAALFATVSFNACSNDDEEASVIDDPAALVGYWQAVRCVGWETCDEHGRDEWDDDETEYDIVFHFDGTNLKIYECGSLGTNTSYRYEHTSEKTFIFCNDSSYYFSGEITVEVLTASQLILYQDYGEDGYQKVIFRRIESL